MACYRVNWKLTEEQLDPIMEWLDANREALGLIRSQANAAYDPWVDKEFWYTKFVFKSEEGARMFQRRWAEQLGEVVTMGPPRY